MPYFKMAFRIDCDMLGIFLVSVLCFLMLARFSHAHDEADDLVYQVGDNPSPQFSSNAKTVRYLLYDVNPGEGFNLRRDVYMRVANLVKFLNDDEPWVLVLPPWGRLYHWKSQHIREQTKLPWHTFFDIASLGALIPVMEFEDYLKLKGEPAVDELYYLQRFKEGWTHWEEKMEICECVDAPRYEQDEQGRWRGWFFGYEEFYARKFQCMSAQAYQVSYKPFLLKNTSANSVFLDRAESLIHGRYSEWSQEFWTARRSLVFSQNLRVIADEFRWEYLDSNDEDDKTVLEPWPDMKRNHGDALGGPYLAVHLRRKDYVHAHGKEVPNLEYAAKQVKQYLKKHNLRKVFLATDAPKSESKIFKEQFKTTKIYIYEPTDEIHNKYKDGGIAIIDQWICAHARVFVGTHVSTFSFRIHEEREILGFESDMTFNRLCGDEEKKKCEQPTQWKIVY